MGRDDASNDALWHHVKLLLRNKTLLKYLDDMIAFRALHSTCLSATPTREHQGQQHRTGAFAAAEQV
eukprot:6212390-Pleurochrysis_carterae.AAC.4